MRGAEVLRKSIGEMATKPNEGIKERLYSVKKKTEQKKIIIFRTSVRQQRSAAVLREQTILTPAESKGIIIT